MPFEYVPVRDAVGMLYQEAAVRMVELLHAGKKHDAEIFDQAAHAIKKAWPELVKQSLEKVP